MFSADGLVSTPNLGVMYLSELELTSQQVLEAGNLELLASQNHLYKISSRSFAGTGWTVL